MARILKFKASNFKNVMILIIIINVFSFSNTYCQDKSYFVWGNNLNDTDKLGSINYAPLNFFTNNIIRGYFSKDGDFYLMTNAFFSKNLYLDSTVQASYLSILHNAKINGILKVGSTISLNGSIVPGQGELPRDEITSSKEALVFGLTNEDVNKFSDIRFGFGTRQPSVNFHIKGRSYVAPPDLNPNVSIKSTENTDISGTTLRIEDEVYGGAMPVGPQRGAWWDITASDKTNKLFIGTKAYDAANKPYTNYLIAINTGGNVGIGTLNPQKKLHVNGDIILSGQAPSLLFSKSENSSIGNYGIQYLSTNQIGNNKAGLNFFIPATNPNNSKNFLLHISEDGNVGIGTGNPAYKLDVCGTIRSKEWIVETGWCDFVFDPNYKRMSWQEKEKYYIEKRHLFAIDSEEEINNNGLQVAKNLKGIILNLEENSLDIIDLYKIIEQQQKEIENLKEEIKLLKNKN